MLLILAETLAVGKSAPAQCQDSCFQPIGTYKVAPALPRSDRFSHNAVRGDIPNPSDHLKLCRNAAFPIRPCASSRK